MRRCVSITAAISALALITTGATAQTQYEGTLGLQTIEPVEHLTPSFERPSIEDFGRLGPDVQTGEGPLPLVAPIWSNGPLDDVTAHLAHRDPAGGSFLAADDFFVKHGDFFFIDQITVCFAVPTYYDGLMNKPVFEMVLHSDCNGRPDAPLTLFDPVEALLVGPSAFPGFNLWTVTFEWAGDGPLILGGQNHYWICPYGVGDFQNGFFYWLSANNGVINGVQGQLKNGAEPWMDVQDCDCPGICTDFYFNILGRICCVLKINGPVQIPNPTGSKSLQLKGATVDTSRAVDNFQVPPGPPRALCAVQAWMATNCPLDKIFLEIYSNDCNMPDAKLHTIDLEGYPLVLDTGIDFNGCDIYQLLWPHIDGINLAPGQDYWLSVVARGTGSILDKAYWIHKLEQGCFTLNLTEGKVKDVFIEGLEQFTFISEATLGPPEDLAFNLWTNPPSAPPTGACCLPDGSCVDGLTDAQCTNNQNGTYQGDNTDCATVSCPQPVGACCFPDGSCADGLTDADCTTQGGAYEGDNTHCAHVSCPQPIGACCFPDTTCADGLTNAECANQGGTYQGNGSNCLAVQCPLETGACCLPSNVCIPIDANSCSGIGGNFIGGDCATVICLQGACCFPGGTCIDFPEELFCTPTGGTWEGLGTDCLNTVCPLDPEGQDASQPGANPSGRRTLSAPLPR